MTVVAMIKDSGRMPVRGECHECFQPKLFYVAGAVLLKTLNLDGGRAAVVAVQLMNCVLGAWTLWVVFLFTQLLPASPAQRLAGFSLVAFNPYLTAIHAQASNDACLVLFSTLALYFLFLFFKDRNCRRRRLLLVTLFAALAGLTKGSGLVLFIGVSLLLLVKLLSEWKNARSRTNNLSYAAAFVLGFLLVVPYFGQYVHNYQAYGTPFVTNLERHPAPYFFKETYPARPGMTSIVNSYFSFYFLELLRVPMISAQPGYDQYHKTSFWTLLYGTTHCLHYYQWPPTWRSQTRAMTHLARAIFVLALVPTSLLLFGLLENTAALGRSLRAGDFKSLLTLRSTALFFAAGFGSFLVIYSLFYRDFGSVKGIYVYPGLLCYLAIWHEGYALCARYKDAAAWINAATLALCLLYITDVASVIARLI